MSAPITIQGRLGADPELRFSPSGMAIANLRIVSHGRKNENGTWVDVDTTWWRVSCFKRLAENVCESLSKGDLVVVVGTVKSREWDDVKTGEKRTAFEVAANVVAADLSNVTAQIKKVERASMDVGGRSSASVDPWADSAARQSDDAPF